MKKLKIGFLPHSFGANPRFLKTPRSVIHQGNIWDNNTLELSPLQVASDMDEIHQWMNMPYSEKFWDMVYDKKTLSEYYLRATLNGSMMALVITIAGQPVAFAEIIPANKEEIAAYFNFEVNAVALHLLMAPPKKLLSNYGNNAHGLSSKVVKFLLEYLFKELPVQTVFLEPDSRNHAAHRIAKNIGFYFKGKYQLSTKTAYLFTINKFDFIR